MCGLRANGYGMAVGSGCLVTGFCHPIHIRFGSQAIGDTIHMVGTGSPATGVDGFGRSAEFQSGFVVDFDDFANKMAIS